MLKKKDWIKDLVIYQIYPRSFKDSNNDGIGDLKGIIEKLDYLKLLGINAIWLSPIYLSPMVDNGYDVQDYYQIDPIFGTMEDFDLLAAEAKKKDIKLIMDLVVNHTSDKHVWFQEAIKDKNSKYSNYYIFKKGVNGKEPNNWEASFKGSAWTYVPQRDEYYLHLFAKEQPDLNFKNKEIREEVNNIIKFWVDKGVSGFRVDAISYLDKGNLNLNLTENLNKDGYAPIKRTIAGSDLTHKYIQGFCKVFNKYNCLSVGEVNIRNDEDYQRYVLTKNREFDMAIPFIPPFVEMKNISSNYLKETFKHRYELLKNGGWWANFLSNHDKPRQIDLYGDGSKDSAKMLATLIQTLPGTPFIYQGEEIGMTNVYYDSIEKYRDIDSINHYKYLISSNYSEEDALKETQRISRDNARSPFQWDDSDNAGFSDVTPWIDVNSNYKEINVKNKIDDPESVFNYYRKLIALRKENEILKDGNLKFLKSPDGTLIYTRKLKEEKWLILLSFIKEDVKIKKIATDYKVILENKDFVNGLLKSFQAVILKIK